MEVIGYRLKHPNSNRHYVGASQSEVAKLFNIAPSTVSNIKNAKGRFKNSLGVNANEVTKQPVPR